MDVNQRSGWPHQRWLGVLLGVGTQGLFLVTVWYLFWFLKDGASAQADASLMVDAVLSLQFAVVHSWLLLPDTRNRITKVLAKEFYGCLFCVATCVGLLGMFAGWQATATTIWDLEGIPRTLVNVGFYGFWVTLFYSLSLTGLGYQTGLTPWWYWLRRKPQPRRVFDPRGAYKVLRHPVYLSFMGLIWFTPRMTLDHALLTGIWTAYIFVGSYLKDERLAFYYGDEYRQYQSRVAGYPLFGFGPLGIRRGDSLGTATLIDAHIGDRSLSSVPSKSTRQPQSSDRGQTPARRMGEEPAVFGADQE